MKTKYGFACKCERCERDERERDTMLRGEPVNKEEKEYVLGMKVCAYVFMYLCMHVKECVLGMCVLYICVCMYAYAEGRGGPVNTVEKEYVLGIKNVCMYVCMYVCT